jgi:acyl-CoA thioester hydrolase
MSIPEKSCQLKFSVPFHDLDPLQVVWHGNYLKYFDVTRADLFNKLGVDLYQVYKDAKYIFPITKTSTKHIFPLRFRDEFICEAKLIEAHYKILIHFEIRLVKNNKLCARGKSEQVAVKLPEMEIMLRIPDAVKKALGF